MPRPNAIVDTVGRLLPVEAAPGLPQSMAVKFASGQSAVLPASDPHFAAYVRLLTDLQRMSIPIYAELVPGSNTIQRLLVPLTVRVTSVSRDPGGDVSVELYISQALHRLTAVNPYFEELLAA